MKTYLIALFIFFLILVACSENNTPKPYGYFRIDLPKKEYQKYDTNLPYTFEYPKYAIIVPNNDNNNPNWTNIDFPKLNARIYLTYKDIKNNLDTLANDSRKLSYKHTAKADAIDENVFVDKDNKVYGILYDIKGNTASSIQFYMTDSVKHFLRGSLYFNSTPNKDSLEPVINFLRIDVDHLIKTLRWNNRK